MTVSGGMRNFKDAHKKDITMASVIAIRMSKLFAICDWIQSVRGLNPWEVLMLIATMIQNFVYGGVDLTPRVCPSVLGSFENAGYDRHDQQRNADEVISYPGLRNERFQSAHDLNLRIATASVIFPIRMSKLFATSVIGFSLFVVLTHGCGLIPANRSITLLNDDNIYQINDSVSVDGDQDEIDSIDVLAAEIDDITSTGSYTIASCMFKNTTNGFACDLKAEELPKLNLNNLNNQTRMHAVKYRSGNRTHVNTTLTFGIIDKAKGKPNKFCFTYTIRFKKDLKDTKFTVIEVNYKDSAATTTGIVIQTTGSATTTSGSGRQTAVSIGLLIGMAFYLANLQI